jgi:peroxiredoxin (alkyl hydroperoxide reductase subunit C)
VFLLTAPAWAGAQTLKDMIYDPGVLKPIDSTLKVRVGQVAPDFTLPSIQGEKIRLSQYRGKKNVVISFVPAAFTPVCSDQWPGYNMARELFEQHNAILLGITVDSIPTLYAWTSQMGDLWFPVLSDSGPTRRKPRSSACCGQTGFRTGAFLHRPEGRHPRHSGLGHQQAPRFGQCAISLDKLDKK